MDPKKLAFSQDVAHMVDDISKLIFNVKSADETRNVFGITHTEMETIIQKIILELPDQIFTEAPKFLEEIKKLCAQEFIFFQVQEHGSPLYQENLKNFIKFFSTDIKHRIEACHHNKS